MSDIGSADDFPEGVIKIIELEGREILVVNWRGNFFAARNICPHQNESFRTGLVRSALLSDTPDGELVVQEDFPLLSCPMHSWTYDLRNGKCTVDPALRIRMFDVKVAEGRVILSTKPVRPVVRRDDSGARISKASSPVSRDE